LRFTTKNTKAGCLKIAAQSGPKGTKAGCPKTAAQSGPMGLTTCHRVPASLRFALGNPASRMVNPPATAIFSKLLRANVV